MTNISPTAESVGTTLTEFGADGRLHLRATRCSHDGTVAFPPERYGCQRCGAFGDALGAILIPARGALQDVVVVNRYRGPGPVAPYSIGQIVTDDGIEVRALVDPGLVSGARVAARIEEAEDGTQLVWFGREG